MAAEEALLDPEEEKKRIKEEKKALKKEQNAAKKEAKARAKEIERREDEIDDGDAGGLSIAMVTIVIIVIWLAILALLIKLDVGGLGSTVMRPLISDVPVLNLILPEESNLGSGLNDTDQTTAEDPYMGFKDLDEAVTYIRQLEREIAQLQSGTNTDSARVEALETEIERLRTFEQAQVEFQRIKDEFYNEVVYAENGPGIDAYAKYYESIEPERAEELYRQVIKQVEADKEMKDYVAAYTAMKPKEAAAIFEAMTDNMALAARILENMDSESRGKIMGAMDKDVAAKLTKLMDPEY